MQIKKFTFNPFHENTFIIWDETKECIIIDPGLYEKNEEKRLVDFISENELNPVKLINTHCHIDHVLGNRYVSEKWNIELYINKKEIEILNETEHIAKMYGFKNYNPSPNPSYFLDHNDIIRFGVNNLRIISAPGHSPGHICLLSKEHKFVIGGDVLFNGSIGRTDLPGGDFDTLIKSITSKLLILEDDTTVYTGHGDDTTIGKERLNNPFLNSSNINKGL